jgi:hypothetical protein
MSGGIFLSKDRSAENKLYDPAFYGATRDSPLPRAVTYVSLLLLQLSHVIAKLATVSLLFTTSGKALADPETAELLLMAYAAMMQTNVNISVLEAGQK